MFQKLFRVSSYLPADSAREVLDGDSEVGSSRGSVLFDPNGFPAIVVVGAASTPENGEC